MKKLVFATNNEHKLTEVRDILGSQFEILSLNDINCHEDIPETADTLEGNAVQKAQYIHQHYNMDCFADDTGLEVEALDGAPGIYSARYASLIGKGETHDSQANIKRLLKELKYSLNRDAQFRTAICLILDGKDYLFEGIVKGEIINEQRGTAGFGYDSVFRPKGYLKTFAELGEDIKNQISHRAVAVQKLAEFLQSQSR
jgi:XTP/dITP diphosphohydrolase